MYYTNNSQRLWIWKLFLFTRFKVEHVSCAQRCEQVWNSDDQKQAPTPSYYHTITNLRQLTYVYNSTCLCVQTLLYDLTFQDILTNEKLAI